MKRVVITGLGAVTPIGVGKDEFWQALEEGRNGVGLLTSFDSTNHNVKIAAEVKNFNPELWLDKKEIRHTDKVIQFAVAAADFAIKDAALDLDALDKNMFGVYIGSGEGGMETMELGGRTLCEKGPHRIGPFMVPMMISNMSAAYVAIRCGAKGPNMAVVTACASSINSIGEAYNCIARGDADVILSGGTEAAITPLATAGFAALKALSSRFDDPEHASRPFDAGRDGFVIGEGAGVIVLEELDHALKRGAHIYGEVVGYGLSCDAHHITAPDPSGDGAARAMFMAVKKAGWKPEEVELINAHGTSTPPGDRMEIAAVRLLMGECAGKAMIQSTKSMIGHLLGAAGAVETIASLMAFEKGIVHPTINQFEKDPECDLNTVPNHAVKADISHILVNGFGFGGHNGVLAMEKYKG